MPMTSTPLAVNARLRACRKLRPFDTQIRAAKMHRRSHGRGRLVRGLGHDRADRIGKRHMHNDIARSKNVDTRVGAIEN